MPADGPSDIHLCESSLEHSTPSTSLLDSRSRISRMAAGTRNHERRGNLGLIDAARVRLTKDLRAFICSTSKLQRVHSISSVQTGDIEDYTFVHSDYANSLPLSLVNLNVDTMEHVSDERQGRGLKTKIAKFLTRSRSRSQSKKRRSRSLDTAVGHMPMPTEGLSVPMHARHPSLEPDTDSRAIASSSGSRPAIISPSRPLPVTAISKPLVRQKRSPAAISTSRPGPSRDPQPVDIRTEVVIYEQSPPDPPRKSKKMNLFGLTLSSPRKASFGDPNKTKPPPPTPGLSSNGKSDRVPWAGRFRSNSGSTSHKSHEDAKRSVKGDILWDNNRPSITTPQPRPTPIHLLNGPPLPHGEYAKVEEDMDAEINSLSGRCSPLCGLGSPNLAAAAVTKGKERERARGARDRSLEPSAAVRSRGQVGGNGRLIEDREKERDKERERITHPRRVGSPIPSGKETRAVVTSVATERVASRSGNLQRKGKGGTSVAQIGSAVSVVRKQIKHGSFDFERPVSAGQTSYRLPGSVDERVTSAPLTLQRSLSARAVPGHERPATRPTEPKRLKPPAQPDPSRPKPRNKPLLDITTQTGSLARRATGSSTATSTQPHSHVSFHRLPGAKVHNNSETDPASPVSSTHSGNSSGLTSSWGKNTSKRSGRPSHPPFKFEPAVPPIPGSPASDEQKTSVVGSDTGRDSPASPLSRPRQARQAGKGRSLDLGLGLSWAPSRVREEAVLRAVPVASATLNASVKPRSRWRGMVPEGDGRLGAASDVAEAFRETLGDAAYATFKTYVHRFDAHAIPLDGPFGLVHHVQRLLDSSPYTDPRQKQALLDRFIRVVQDHH